MLNSSTDEWILAKRKYYYFKVFLLLFSAVYLAFMLTRVSLTAAVLESQSLASTTFQTGKKQEISNELLFPKNMITRTRLVRTRCKNVQVDMDNITIDDIPKRLLTSDLYRLIGCKAAKVAGTNLQRIFYVLENLTNNTNSAEIKKKDARKNTVHLFLRESNHTLEEIKYRLTRYKKFMLVRHPLERLVSAYRDRKPLQLFTDTKHLTFRKYVSDILHTPNLTRPGKTVFQQCKPCLVQYDFIGSLHDFKADLETILTAVHAHNAVTIPRRNETGYTDNKSSVVMWKYYQKVPLNVIDEIEKFYETDYFFFGFQRYRNMTK